MVDPEARIGNSICATHPYPHRIEMEWTGRAIDRDVLSAVSRRMRTPDCGGSPLCFFRRPNMASSIPPMQTGSGNSPGALEREMPVDVVAGRALT